MSDEQERFLTCSEPPVGCGKMLPVDAFDLAKAIAYQGKQHLACNGCRLTWAERNRNLVVIEKKEELLAASRRDQDSLILSCPDITDLWKEILENFGGIREFATFWVNNLKITGSERPGGKFVLDGMAAFGRVCYAATIQQNNLIAAEKKTDEDLLAEREKLMEALAEKVAEMLMDRGVVMQPEEINRVLVGQD